MPNKLYAPIQLEDDKPFCIPIKMETYM